MKKLLVSLRISNETTCYLYPQFEYTPDEKDIVPINNKKVDYPDRGTIYLPKSSEENLNDYLYKLFKISFDSRNITNNYNEYDYYSSKCKYYARINDIEELARNELIEIIPVDKLNIDKLLQDKKSRFIDLNHLPLNKLILIKIDNYCYGPFSYVREDNSNNVIKIIPDDEEYVICKYDYNEVKSYAFEAKVTYSADDDSQKMFIKDLDTLYDNIRIVEKIDFIDNEMLIQECIKVITEGNKITEIDKNGLNVLKSMKLLLEKYPDLSNKYKLFTENNINRIKEIIHNTTLLDEYKNKIINDYYYSGKITENEKNNYLENHPELVNVVFENSDINRELSNKRRCIEEDIKELEIKRQKFSNELNEIKGNVENYKEKVLTDVQNNIIQLNAQKEDLENRNKYIKQQIEIANQQRTELARELNELNIDIKNKVLSWINDNRNDEIMRLLITGMEQYNVPKNNVVVQYNIKKYKVADDIIRRVEEYFLKNNYQVNKNEIINYFILLTNNFITVFGGKPGTGKTSTCNILANALGLAESRYADISVARGWTSSRDLIGYYNPLTNCLEKTQPKFSKCLEIMTNEDKNGLSDSLYLVLLDEANLSQIEHYWSEFIKISDDFNNKIIELSTQIQYTIIEELRFVATINYDHTTEILSPRFIDRAWFVLMDVDNTIDLFSGIENNGEISNADDIISYDSLMSLFSIKSQEFKDKNMSIYSKEILASFINAFKEAGYNLSARSIKSIRNYCIVAEKYMQGEKQTSADYAISQKILPQINGNGIKYLNFLEVLKKLCIEHQLIKSTDIITKIISVGKEEHNYFNYFNI